MRIGDGFISVGSLLGAADVRTALVVLGGILALGHFTGRTLKSRIARVVGIAINVVALISSLLVIAEYVFHLDFFVGSLLFPGVHKRGVFTETALGLPFAVSLGCLSIAYLSRFRRGDPDHRIVDFLAIAAAILTALSFGFSWVRHRAPVISWLSSFILIILLATLLLLARRHERLPRAIRRSALTVRLLRPLLVGIVIIPIVIHHLSDLGAALRIYPPTAAAAVESVATTVTLLVLAAVLGRQVLVIESARATALDKLRASESRLILQFETMPIACLVRDSQLRIESWNPAAETIFGYSAAEMLNQTTDVLVPPEELERIEEVRKHVLSGVQDGIVCVNKTRTGKRIVCKWSNAPMLDSDGNVKGILSMVEDITEPERVRDELQQSEKRYRRIVENMIEGLVVLDNRQYATYVNDQYCAIVEQTPSDLIGRLVLEHWSPASHDVLKIHLGRRAAGIDEHYEATLETKSGRSVHVLVSAAPIMEDGVSLGSVALVSDVTEKKLATDRLLIAERRYRELIDAIPAHIFSEDLSGRITAANRNFVEALGAKRDDVIGKTLEELRVSPEGGSWPELRSRALDGGREETFETAIVFPGVKLRRFSVTINLLRGPEGQINGLTVLAFDITDQRDVIRTTRRLLHAAEEMSEVLFTTDRNGVIDFANLAFERVYGWSRDEVIGQTPRILRGEHSAEWYAQFWNEILAGRPVHTEYVNLRKDGRPVHVAASVTPFRGENGAIEGFIAIQEDVTAQKQAEKDRRQLDEQIAEISKMNSLGTLAGGIAHDFNNILGVILSHIALIERGLTDRVRVASATETIRQAVKRGADLARQVLTFARRTEVTLAPVNLGSEIVDIVGMIRATFPRRIDIVTEIEEGLPPVEGDVGQIHRALLNLCVNARDAMPDGGLFRIEARKASEPDVARRFGCGYSEQYVEVVVSDTGVGMSEETQRHVFEPFYTTKPKGKGTGLGLALVYGVMMSHHGLVECESQIGQGSSFHLYFPVTVGPIATKRHAISQESRGDATVLVIEDEDAIRSSVVKRLRESGFVVVSAANGDDAVELCRDLSDLDVVLTDLGLPGTSPVDFLRSLRAMFPHFSLIAMTGYVDADVQAEVRAAGAKCILQKPFEFEDLLQQITV